MTSARPFRWWILGPLHPRRPLGLPGLPDLTLRWLPIFLAAPNKPGGLASTPSKEQETADTKGGSVRSERSPESEPAEPAEPDDVKQHVARLVARTKKGDRDAYRELVERYQKRVYGIVYGMLHSREDAMELSQDVFIKVFQRIGEFEEKSSFYTWVYRIAVNLAIDFRRKEWKKTHTEYDDDLADDGIDDGVFQRDRRNPEQMSQDRQLGEQIEKALAGLPEEQRAVLVMREVEGLSYEQMAEMLDCPIGTIMSRLFYARKKMQQSLKDLKR